MSLNEFKAVAESKKLEILEAMIGASSRVSALIEKNIRDGFEKNIGVLSLTESPNNLLMWAHYANSHKGMVIGLDSTHPFFDQRKTDKDEFRHLKKLAYQKVRPKHAMLDIKSIDDFLVKGSEWKYEQEWRMLMSLRDADKKIICSPYDIHLFKLPFSAIKSIRLGARSAEDTKIKIRSILKQNPMLNHVNYFEMDIDDEQFALNEMSIKIL